MMIDGSVFFVFFVVLKWICFCFLYCENALSL